MKQNNSAIAKQDNEAPAIVSMRAKKLSGLKDNLMTPFGQPEVTKEGMTVTLGIALVLMLSAQKVDPIQSLSAAALIDRLLQKDTVTLEEAEWALLKTTVEKNPQGFGAYLYAQIYRHFA